MWLSMARSASASVVSRSVRTSSVTHSSSEAVAISTPPAKADATASMSGRRRRAVTSRTRCSDAHVTSTISPKSMCASSWARVQRRSRTVRPVAIQIRCPSVAPSCPGGRPPQHRSSWGRLVRSAHGLGRIIAPLPFLEFPLGGMANIICRHLAEVGRFQMVVQATDFRGIVIPQCRIDLQLWIHAH